MTLLERYQLSQFSRILNSKYGISAPPQLASIGTGDADVFLYKFPQMDYRIYGGSNTFAAGCGPERLTAFFSACGEAIERYAGFLPVKEKCVFGSYDELKARYPLVEMNNWSLFSEAQYTSVNFGLVPWRADLRLYWLPMIDVGAKEVVYVPLDHMIDHGDRRIPRIERPTTSGLAAGASFQNALDGAVFELLERDAVMRAWWNVETLDAIDWQPLLQTPQFAAFLPLQDRVQILDLKSVTGHPCVMAVYCGENTQQQPGLLTSAACHRDERIAIRKALSEVAHLLIRSRAQFFDRMKNSIPQDLDEVRTFLEHVFFYHFDAHQNYAKFLWSDAKAPRPVRDTKDLRPPAEALQASGFLLYHHDLTPRDLASLKFSVVRAYSPNLVPLNAAHRDRPLGHPRIKASPVNPWPHPFS